MHLSLSKTYKASKKKGSQKNRTLQDILYHHDGVRDRPGGLLQLQVLQTLGHQDLMGANVPPDNCLPITLQCKLFKVEWVHACTENHTEKGTLKALENWILQM